MEISFCMSPLSVILIFSRFSTDIEFFTETYEFQKMRYVHTKETYINFWPPILSSVSLCFHGYFVVIKFKRQTQMT